MIDPINILLIEDNSDHRDLFLLNLELTGFRTGTLVQAETLSRGRTLLNERSFHIVFLDLSLPDSDIEHTLSAIIQIKRYCPVVVMTSLDDRDTILEVIQKGADDCLPKSELKPTLLERSIQFNLDRHQERQQLIDNEKSLHQYKRIIDSAQDQMSFLDRHYIYQTVNDAYLKIHGKKREEIIGHTPAFLLGEETFHHTIKERLDRCLQGEIIQYAEWFEFPQAGRRYMDVTYIPYRDENGEINGIVASSHDNTELQEYREHLEILVEKEVNRRKTQEELLIQQSKMAAMGEMISAIAHQWKQPLNTLSWMTSSIVDIFKQADDQEAELEKLGEDMLEQVTSMSEIIDDFRDFFKPSDENIRFDPHEHMDKLASMLDKTLAKQNIHLVVHPGKKLSVMGKPNEFKQVLLNLFINARDIFIERKVKSGKIECFFESHQEGRITIKIRDNGGGIPKKLLPDKLFHSYVSTKGEQGTGIGLQISKMIIEQHMLGKLWVHNVDHGAEFVIELPLVSNT